jgi:hypothetical protein
VWQHAGKQVEVKHHPALPAAAQAAAMAARKAAAMPVNPAVPANARAVVTVRAMVHVQEPAAQLVKVRVVEHAPVPVEV